LDQGAKALSSIASVLDSNDPQEIARMLEQIDDPVRLFDRFSIPASFLRRKSL